MTMELFLKIMFWLNFALGIISFLNYCYVVGQLPPAIRERAKYTGGSYWIAALIIAAVLYVKGT